MRLAAVVDIATGDANDPAFLEQLMQASVPITLAEGDRKVQDLRIAGLNRPLLRNPYNRSPVPDPVIIPRADHPFRAGTSILTRCASSVAFRSRATRRTRRGQRPRLMLGRQPKDFDIGTDAHPYQIKRLFRNCWIIGRRFRWRT